VRLLDGSGMSGDVHVPFCEGPRVKFPWSTHLTYLSSTVCGIFYYLYLIEDIFSRKIVGWEIRESESAGHASQLIGKTCLAENIHQEGLVLHSDNGSPMKGATMLATLQKLGVVTSFSRYPNQPFEDLTAAREWVHSFVQWYNNEHRHSAIRFVTPSQRHSGADDAILAQRKRIHEAAKQRNPARWSGKIRNWDRIEEVWLNPPKAFGLRNKKQHWQHD